MADPTNLIDYFLICGLGIHGGPKNKPGIYNLEGTPGFHGLQERYWPSILDQYPAFPTKEPGWAAALPSMVLPGGVRLHEKGTDLTDPAARPRSYPTILTQATGANLYISVLVFRDPVGDPMGRAFALKPGLYADKCLCLVARRPFLDTCREILEHIYSLCFSCDSHEPLWDMIESLVTCVRAPPPGKRVIFALQDRLLRLDSPPPGTLPLCEFSMQCLVECLDVDHLLQLFMALLQERKIFFRSHSYALLTLASKALLELLYPVKWMYAYIPILMEQWDISEMLCVPGGAVMGLQASVDISNESPDNLDGVVLVDLDHNTLKIQPTRFAMSARYESEAKVQALPPLPEPEGVILRQRLLELVHPCLTNLEAPAGARVHKLDSARWSAHHDHELRLIFLDFFVSLLKGYRATWKLYTEDKNEPPLAKYSRDDFLYLVINRLNAQGALANLQSGEKEPPFSDMSLINQLQDPATRAAALARLHFRNWNMPAVTISCTHPLAALGDGRALGPKRDRFPPRPLSFSQEAMQTFALNDAREDSLRSRDGNGEASKWTKKSAEYESEREHGEIDTESKLQHWIQLLETELKGVPPSGFYENLEPFIFIKGQLEDDCEGWGGRGLVQCLKIRLGEEQQLQLACANFEAYADLLLAVADQATQRGELRTAGSTLELSTRLYRITSSGIRETLTRHLAPLPIWRSPNFWEGLHFWEGCTKSRRDQPHEMLNETSHLMVELGLHDAETWPILGYLGRILGISSEHQLAVRHEFVRARRRLSYFDDAVPIAALRTALSDLTNHVTKREGAGTLASKAEPAVKVSTQSELGGGPRAGSHKEVQAHGSAITALQTVQQSTHSLGLISAAADGSVKMWDESLRKVASLEGHKKAVRCVASSAKYVVTAGDDCQILLFDRAQGRLVSNLDLPDTQVRSVQLASRNSAEFVLTASDDGALRIWDLRTPKAATAVLCRSSLLCLDSSDAYVATAGSNRTCHLYDWTAGKELLPMAGHLNWIRSVKLLGERVATASDDWTARLWAAPSGECEAVLCHGGPVRCVEFQARAQQKVVTGCADGSVAVWELSENTWQSTATPSRMAASVLALSCHDTWIAAAAANNAMSLIHCKAPKLSVHLSSSPCQVRLAACGFSQSRGFLCTAGAAGLVQLWTPPLRSTQTN